MQKEKVEAKNLVVEEVDSLAVFLDPNRLVVPVEEVGLAAVPVRKDHLVVLLVDRVRQIVFPDQVDHQEVSLKTTKFHLSKF